MNERTVLGVPRVPSGMLAREALLERIGRTPLTVVRGPGGSGKTVLMSQWMARSVVPAAWVTVEPDIGERAAFWGAVADAAGHAGLRFCLPPEGGRADDGLRPALLRAFRERAEPFLLVVDDAHELRDPAVLDDLLEILHACPAVVAIVGSRTHSALEAPRQALTLDRTVLGPDELRLTTAEVERIAGDAGPAHGTTAQLLEASGGSPLLLRAILLGASGGAGPLGSPAVVVRDLLDGVFGREPGDLAAFASATAIPDDVDEALAEHLSGADAERTAGSLAALEANGLLMRREAADGPRFRYHPLVREVLRDELRGRRPDRYRGLSLLASAAAEAHGGYLTALRHAVDAEDWARASDVCLHGGLALLRSRGAAVILQRVPLRYVARLPFIAIVLGLAANARGERFKALELMTLALGASRASRSRQRVAERIGLALVESVVLRITGRAGDSVAAARRMLALVDEAPPAELEEIAGQLDGFRLQAALSLFRGGAIAEAQVAAERAGTSTEALDAGDLTALGATSAVAAVQAIRGECQEASATLDRIDHGDFSDALRGEFMGALSHLARGIVALEQGDTQVAGREADFARGRPNLEHGMLFTLLAAVVALWEGRPQTGLRLVAEKEGADRPRARISSDDRRAAAYVRTLLHASLGQLGAAHEELRGLDRGDPVAAVLEAEVLLLEQRPELAADRLARAGELPGPRLQAAADVLVATISSLAADDEVAERALRRFLAAGAVHGVSSPLVLIPAAYRGALFELGERLGASEETLEHLRALPAPFEATGTRVVLTRRETELLARLRTDASQAVIAASLGVSPNTVKSHLRTLYRKLGASTREEALRAAYLQGLAGLSPERGGLSRG